MSLALQMGCMKLNCLYHFGMIVLLKVCLPTTLFLINILVTTYKLQQLYNLPVGLKLHFLTFIVNIL